MNITETILDSWFRNGGVPCIPGPGLQLGRHAVADAAYQMLASQFYIGYSSLTASRAMTLPLASTLTIGQVLVVADESGSASATVPIVVTPTGSDTINGVNAAVQLKSARSAMMLMCIGSGAFQILFSGAFPKNLYGRTAVSDAAYQMLVTDSYVGYTALTAARIGTLPALAGVADGAVFILGDEAGAAATYNLTLKGSGSELIDNANTAVISTNFGTLKVIKAGTIWKKF